MQTEPKLKRPLRLLIVEDSKSDVALLVATLRAGGFAVTYEMVATEAAMRSALHHEWDLITSDHTMPQFSGPAALSVALELSPDVPIIMVSAEMDINLAVSLIQAGAQDFVQKTELDRLVPIVERVLRERTARNDQLQAEQALIASEAQYRRLFEAAQDGILIADAETGQIRDVNPFLLDLLGFSKEEYLGKKLWELAASKDTEASKSAYRELQQTGYIRYDNIPLRAKLGESVEVEFVSNIYEVGQDKVIQCNIRHVSEHRQDSVSPSVSNDLRAPLGQIDGSVAELEKVCGAGLNPIGMDLIHAIRSSTEQMKALIHIPRN